MLRIIWEKKLFSKFLPVFPGGVQDLFNNLQNDTDVGAKFSILMWGNYHHYILLIFFKFLDFLLCLKLYKIEVGEYGDMAITKRQKRNKKKEYANEMLLVKRGGGPIDMLTSTMSWEWLKCIAKLSSLRGITSFAKHWLKHSLAILP